MAQLTRTEISSLPADTNVYEGVGKMYVISSIYFSLSLSNPISQILFPLLSILDSIALLCCSLLFQLLIPCTWTRAAQAYSIPQVHLAARIRHEGQAGNADQGARRRRGDPGEEAALLGGLAEEQQGPDRSHVERRCGRILIRPWIHALCASPDVVVVG